MAKQQPRGKIEDANEDANEAESYALENPLDEDYKPTATSKYSKADVAVIRAQHINDDKRSSH